MHITHLKIPAEAAHMRAQWSLGRSGLHEESESCRDGSWCSSRTHGGSPHSLYLTHTPSCCAHRVQQHSGSLHRYTVHSTTDTADMLWLSAVSNPVHKRSAQVAKGQKSKAGGARQAGGSSRAGGRKVALRALAALEALARSVGSGPAAAAQLADALLPLLGGTTASGQRFAAILINSGKAMCSGCTEHHSAGWEINADAGRATANSC